jgi:NAD(P)-dependent dehydrogenase (short-subunit alcohol dehydrogenase family)
MAAMARVWLITGCSSGFGEAIARAALQAGDEVVATARSTEALADLEASGAHAAALDVTDAAAIDRVVADVLDRHGGIDVLVNNAGIGSVGAVEELTMDELRAIFEVMFFGAAALAKAVLPGMRERGSGAIVQISSMGGQVVFPGYGAYCATKFALEALSEALAAEVAPLGIRVVIVEPGAFRTGLMSRGMVHSREIDAYAPTAGATREAAAAMDGTQQGDPAKAAAAILRAVESDEPPPLHLALGADAVEAIRGQHERLAADLAAWEDVSRATDFDA